MAAGWAKIGDLDEMGLEEVHDWHDYYMACREAEAEVNRPK